MGLLVLSSSIYQRQLVAHDLVSPEPIVTKKVCEYNFLVNFIVSDSRRMVYAGHGVDGLGRVNRTGMLVA